MLVAFVELLSTHRIRGHATRGEGVGPASHSRLFQSHLRMKLPMTVAHRSRWKWIFGDEPCVSIVRHVGSGGVVFVHWNVPAACQRNGDHAWCNRTTPRADVDAVRGVTPNLPTSAFLARFLLGWTQANLRSRSRTERCTRPWRRSLSSSLQRMGRLGGLYRGGRWWLHGLALHQVLIRRQLTTRKGGTWLRRSPLRTVHGVR